MLVRPLINSFVIALQHESKMDMRKVCPIFGSSAESFPVADIRIIRLDSLNLLLNELIVCRWNTLPLLWGTSNEPRIGFVDEGGRLHRHPGVPSGGGAQVDSVFRRRRVTRNLNILPGGLLQRLECSSHVHSPKISTVPTSNCHNIKEAVAWNTNRKNNIAEAAGNVTELLRHIHFSEIEKNKTTDEEENRTKKVGYSTLSLSL